MTSPQAPGQAHREGITLMQLATMFPDEESAFRWFETRFLAPRPHLRTLRQCQHQGGQPRQDALLVHGFAAPTRHQDRHAAGYTQLPLRKWVFAIHLHLTSPRGRLQHEAAPGHRGLAERRPGTCSSASARRSRIADDDNGPFGGPVEVDETCVGGKRANMSNAKRKAQTGRGTVGAWWA